jgi:hypothetical protein
MKEATGRRSGTAIPFTKKLLEQLKREGYTHVRVKGITRDNHLDYMEPHCLVLVPVKGTGSDGTAMEIYEPIHSELLNAWADNDEGTKVLVSMGSF